MLTPTPGSRKVWVAPEMVLEKALMARAQDPETDGLGTDSGLGSQNDPFLGPLNASQGP